MSSFKDLTEHIRFMAKHRMVIHMNRLYSMKNQAGGDKRRYGLALKLAAMECTCKTRKLERTDSHLYDAIFRLRGEACKVEYIMATQLTLEEKKAIYMETYMVKYREKNKEAILNQRMIYLKKTIVSCCGMEVPRHAQLQHNRALKHKRALEQLPS